MSVGAEADTVSEHRAITQGDLKVLRRLVHEEHSRERRELARRLAKFGVSGNSRSIQGAIKHLTRLYVSLGGTEADLHEDVKRK